MRRVLIGVVALAFLCAGCGGSDSNELILNDDVDFVMERTLVDSSDRELGAVWSGVHAGKVYSLVDTDSSVYGGVYELQSEDGCIRISEADGCYPIDACIDIDGNLYIANIYGIYVFDGNGRLIGSYEDDTISINSLAVSSDGTVYYTYIAGLGSGTGYIGKVDSDADTELVYEVNNLTNNESLRVLGVNQGFDDVVLMHKDSLYSIDVDEGSTSILLDIGMAGLDDIDAPSIYSSNGCIYVYGTVGDLFDDAIQVSGLYKIEVTYPETTRETIKLAVFNEDKWVQKVVDRFNASNPGYKVVIEYNYDMDPTVFASQCLTDECADIVISNSEYISLLDGEDVLADLDEVCSFDETVFVDNLWDSMTNSEGVRTWITPFVSIEGMYTVPGTGLRDDSLMTLDSMEAYIRSRSSSAHFIRYDDVVVLQNMLVNSFMPNVYELGEFCAADYCDLLEFAEEHARDDLEETSGVASQLASGELIFVDSDMGSFLQYVLLSEYFQDSFDYCGRPLTDGLRFSADMFVSVLESSDKKNGCEEFIQFILEDDNLCCTMHDNLFYMPITNSGVRNNIDMTLGLYENNQITDNQIVYCASDGSASGGMSLPLLMYSSGDGSDRIVIDGNPDTDVYHRYTGPSGRRVIDDPENYIDEYMRFISDVHGFAFVDYDAMVIVEEELEAFRSGQRDAATTADVTANRVQTVMNERG